MRPPLIRPRLGHTIVQQLCNGRWLPWANVSAWPRVVMSVRHIKRNLEPLPDSTILKRLLKSFAKRTKLKTLWLKNCEEVLHCLTILVSAVAFLPPDWGRFSVPSQRRLFSASFSPYKQISPSNHLNYCSDTLYHALTKALFVLSCLILLVSLAPLEWPANSWSITSSPIITGRMLRRRRKISVSTQRPSISPYHMSIIFSWTRNLQTPSKTIPQHYFLSLIPCKIQTPLTSYLSLRTSYKICSPRWTNGQMVIGLDGSASRLHLMLGKRAKLSKTSISDGKPWIYFSGVINLHYQAVKKAGKSLLPWHTWCWGSYPCIDRQWLSPKEPGRPWCWYHNQMSSQTIDVQYAWAVKDS